MKKLFLLVPVLLAVALPSYPQNGNPPMAGARGAAMGNTGLCFTDIHSAFSNQAGLAYLPAASAAAQAERRFMISDIQSFSAAAALPTSSGAFGLTLNYYGFEDYNEQRLGMAYARKLLNNLSIGAQFLWLNTRITDYGSKSIFTFEAGILTDLLPELQVAAHVYSPARVRMLEDEYLPTILSLGLSYRPSEKLTFNGEVEKDIEFPMRIKAGIEYQIVDPLLLRLGVATEPVSLAFGIGLKIDEQFFIDLSSNYHQILGLTPAIGISYRGGKK